jgi:FAD/FMN-containing dehydrogenase
MLSISPRALDLRGRLITPDDALYDATRTVFMGGFDRRPALIARPLDAADVARVVLLARDAGAELAVRGGGHSPAGHSVSDGGIVLDLRDMRGIEIDVEGRTAWAQAGLTAGDYSAAVGEHGLATGFGDAAAVGIGGITLSGGIGFLVRKHGMTIDQLIAAEIVTAEGHVVFVDEDHHPDLFWAIRGGGGNFGVVSRLRFRLHDVSEFTGGALVLPASADAIERVIALAAEAPDELSVVVNVGAAPPLPFLAPEVHGRRVVMAVLAWTGDTASAQSAIAPFRALGEPLADVVRPMPYAQLLQPLPPDYHPVAAARTGFTSRVDGGAILAALDASTAVSAAVQLRVLGGAMARVPADATAFAHREARVLGNILAMYSDPGAAQEQELWVADLADRLFDSRAAYAGFLRDEGEARIRAAYPEATYARLAAVKAKWDPANLFRMNQNIAPAPR